MCCKVNVDDIPAEGIHVGCCTEVSMKRLCFGKVFIFACLEVEVALSGNLIIIADEVNLHSYSELCIIFSVKRNVFNADLCVVRRLCISTHKLSCCNKSTVYNFKVAFFECNGFKARCVIKFSIVLVTLCRPVSIYCTLNSGFGKSNSVDDSCDFRSLDISIGIEVTVCIAEKYACLIKCEVYICILCISENVGNTLNVVDGCKVAFGNSRSEHIADFCSCNVSVVILCLILCLTDEVVFNSIVDVHIVPLICL